MINSPAERPPSLHEALRVGEARGAVARVLAVGPHVGRGADALAARAALRVAAAVGVVVTARGLLQGLALV